MMNRRFMCMVTAIVMLLWAGAAAAQPPAGGGAQTPAGQAPRAGMMGVPQGPPSPEILADNRVTFRETPGGHTWFNWRIYLSDYAPMLFR